MLSLALAPFCEVRSFSGRALSDLPAGPLLAVGGFFCDAGFLFFFLLLSLIRPPWFLFRLFFYVRFHLVACKAFHRPQYRLDRRVTSLSLLFFSL